MKEPSQGKSKHDPVVSIYFFLALREDAAHRWCPNGMPGWTPRDFVLQTAPQSSPGKPKQARSPQCAVSRLSAGERVAGRGCPLGVATSPERNLLAVNLPPPSLFPPAPSHEASPHQPHGRWGLGLDGGHPPDACLPGALAPLFPTAGEASACIRGAELRGTFPQEGRGWVGLEPGLAAMWMLSVSTDCIFTLSQHVEGLEGGMDSPWGWCPPCEGLSRDF